MYYKYNFYIWVHGMLLVCFGELQFLFERYFCVHHMLMVLLQGMHVNDNYTCLCVVSTKFMNIQPPCPLMNKQFLGNQNGKRYTFKFLSESNNTFWLLCTHQFSLSWYTVNFTMWSDFAQSILLIIGIKSVTVVIGP